MSEEYKTLASILAGHSSSPLGGPTSLQDIARSILGTPPPDGLLGPTTANPLMMAKALNQREAYPRRLQDSTGDALGFGAGLFSLVPGVGDAMGLAADLHKYKTEPESRTWTNFGLTGLGLLPLVPGMTVFHGSPHKFDALDSSKIGTGEGAQSYGKGMYFAENPTVAQSYQQPSGKMQHKTTGEVVDSRQIPMGKVHEYGPVTGNLYKADLPDEQIARMVNWDAPIAAQPAGAKLVLENLRRETSAARGVGNDSIGDILKAAIRLGLQPEKRLSAVGVPGIRYLDEGSRQAGRGTSNFVVFQGQSLPKVER